MNDNFDSGKSYNFRNYSDGIKLGKELVKKIHNIIRFTILYVCLLVAEIIESTLMLFVYSFDYSFDIIGCFTVVAIWTVWRLMFFSLPFTLLHLLFFRYLKNIKLNRLLILSFFKLFIYVSLTAFSKIIYGDNMPLQFRPVMFSITCVAIFLSPLILGRIPFFKKLMGILI